LHCIYFWSQEQDKEVGVAVQWKNGRWRKRDGEKQSWEYRINKMETVKKRMQKIFNNASIYKRVEMIQAWNSYISSSGNNIFLFQPSVSLESTHFLLFFSHPQGPGKYTS